MQSTDSLRIFLPSASSMILFAEKVLELREGLNPIWCGGYFKIHPLEVYDIEVIPDEGLLCQLVELALDSFEGLGVALQACSEQLTESELIRLNRARLRVNSIFPGYGRWKWLNAEWDPERDEVRYNARARVKLLFTSFRTYTRKARDEGR